MQRSCTKGSVSTPKRTRSISAPTPSMPTSMTVLAWHERQCTTRSSKISALVYLLYIVTIMTFQNAYSLRLGDAQEGKRGGAAPLVLICVLERVLIDAARPVACGPCRLCNSRQNAADRQKCARPRALSNRTRCRPPIGRLRSSRMGFVRRPSNQTTGRGSYRTLRVTRRHRPQPAADGGATGPGGPRSRGAVHVAAVGDARLRPLPGTTKNSTLSHPVPLLLHISTSTFYTPTRTHPHQTDTSAPWDKNASKRFHPLQAQILKRPIYTDLSSTCTRALTFQNFSPRACRSHTCSLTVLTSSTRTRQISAVFLTC